MITLSCFKDQHVALFGLGGSGIASALALMAGGARVSAFDDGETAREQAKAAGVPLVDLHSLDWNGVAALLLSPGVPLTHPAPHWAARLARDNHVEIIGDMELFARQRAVEMARQGEDEQDYPLIAITGTNGKSTTTALIAHLLRYLGHDVEMGGNIGTPILALQEIKKRRIYVIECSSYQIDLAPSLKPTIGVLTNITPDHIDRHGTFAHYSAIKERLVANAGGAIIAVDDAPCRAVAMRIGKATLVSTEQPLAEGLFFDQSAGQATLFRARGNNLTAIASLAGIASLRGQHNGQNALLALAACEAAGVDMGRIQAALGNFNGLPHRMEQVGRIGNILFINDSKATNAQATAPALSTFEKIYWIAGGVAKEGGIEALKPFFGKIHKAYLIGEAAQDFHRTIGDALPVCLSQTLESAVAQATADAMADMAKGSDTGEAAVLLSPACASFDQFANYSARGDAFRTLVNNLIVSARENP